MNSLTRPLTLLSAFLRRNLRRIFYSLATILALVLFAFFLSRLDWQTFGTVLGQARYSWLPLLAVWNSFIFLVRAWRWRFLVQTEKPVSLVDVFFANMVGFLGNLILPARAGSLVRAAYLTQLTRVSVAHNLATQVVQRVVDTAFLAGAGALALSASGLAAPELRTPLLAVSLLIAAGLALILFVPRFNPWLVDLVTRIPLPGRTAAFRPRLLGLLEKFLLGLRSLTNRRAAAGFGLATLLLWLLDAIGLILVAGALNFSLTIYQAFVILAGWGLATVIPLTPGGLGVVQLVAGAMLSLYGFSNEEILAFLLLGQVMEMILILVWGLIGLQGFLRVKSPGLQPK